MRYTRMPRSTRMPSLACFSITTPVCGLRMVSALDGLPAASSARICSGVMSKYSS